MEMEAARLAESWKSDPRWEGINRDYTAEDVVRLRGSIREQSTLANRMAIRLWEMLTTKDYVSALGALSGGQAVQMVKAGLYKPGEVDLAKVATYQFVNKKIGLDVKAKLGGK